MHTVDDCDDADSGNKRTVNGSEITPTDQRFSEPQSCSNRTVDSNELEMLSASDKAQSGARCNTNVHSATRSAASPIRRSSIILGNAVHLRTSNRPLKRRAITHTAREIAVPQNFVQNNLEEEEVSNDQANSQDKTRTFDVVSDELLAEARHNAAELSGNPTKALDLLFKLQSIVANLQEALGQRTRIHVILEAATQGKSPKTKFRHVVPIFSRTLIPSFCIDLHGSAVVVTSLIEALAIAEKVANSDRNSAMPTLDYRISCTIEVSLPSWYPGEPCTALSSQQSEYSTLSAYSKFDGSAEAKEAAADELRKIYSSYVTQSIEGHEEVDLTAVRDLTPTQSHGARILYCNPTVFERLSKIEIKSFALGWREFFLHLRKSQNGGAKSGPLVYKRFTLPWLHGTVHFLVGRKSVDAVRVTGAKLPLKKEVQTEVGARQLARCILMNWVVVQPESRAYLLRTLAKCDCVITEGELSYSNWTSVQPTVGSSNTEFDTNNSWLFDTEHVKQHNYCLNESELNSLRPFHVPCNTIMDYFLDLLRAKSSGRVIVFPVRFTLALAEFSTPSMVFWNTKIDKTAMNTASNIIIPLNDDATHHWGMAVIEKGSRTIDIYDSMPRRHVFSPIYPSLLRWLRVFLRRHVDVGWKCDLQFSERSDLGDGHDLAVDSAIFACIYAARAVGTSEFRTIRGVNVAQMRKKIRDALVSGNLS